MRFPYVTQITRPKTFFWILENVFEIIDFLFTSSVMYQIFLYDLFILFYDYFLFYLSKFILFYFFLFKIEVLKLLNKNVLISFFHFRNLVTMPDGTRMSEKTKRERKVRIKLIPEISQIRNLISQNKY